MASKLKEELRQNKPFASLEEEVFLNLLRTGDALVREVSRVLKPFGLSPTQYNVLRILRGAGEAGLTCGEVGERMVTHDPDITRLMDRMEKRGLIRRSRDVRDRRVITSRITPVGMEILRQLDVQNPSLLSSLLGHLGQHKLKNLSALLEEARCQPGVDTR
jgi:DNA-binding MarR family transcriptional regulator